MSLAAEIRRLLAAYEDAAGAGGLHRGGGRQGHGARGAVPAARSPGPTRPADEARGGRRAGRPGSPERGESLRRAALHAAAAARLAAEMERDVSRTRGEGLEAGVFVSFGAGAAGGVDRRRGLRPQPGGHRREDQRVGPRDGPGLAGPGPRRPARSPPPAPPRATPALRHAWSVFIGQPLTLAIPPDAAAEVLGGPGRGHDRRHAGGGEAGPAGAGGRRAGPRTRASGDVYNAGAALSEEALTAWLEAVGRSAPSAASSSTRPSVPEEVAAAVVVRRRARRAWW